MSWVTQVLLNLGIDNEDQIGNVNEFFEEYEVDGLVSVDSPDLPWQWYGGDEPFLRPLYIGSYNHIDIEAFAEHLRSLTFPNPDLVQLIIADELGDFRFVKV